MEKTVVRVCCSLCHKMFKLKDRVYLDTANGLRHIHCYTLDHLSIKDTGTYLEIIRKYDFFNELIKE